MAPHTPIDDTDGLIARVHNLPPELFNEIQDLVFTPDTDTVNITRDYKPPPQLRFSRVTRAAFAAKYFSQSTTFTSTLSRKQQVRGWLHSLAIEHRNLIDKVQLAIYHLQTASGELKTVYRAKRPNELLGPKNLWRPIDFIVHSDGTVYGSED